MIRQLSGKEVFDAKNLVERNDLSFEDDFDVIVGLYENKNLIATGARAKNVLKMFVVDPAYKGQLILGGLAGTLVANGHGAGHETLFVFTKAEYARNFQALQFDLLANQGDIALLEYGPGLQRWLDSNKSLVRQGVNGAVIVNCNPFTNGHRYLIETAAKEVDNLYVFVVREDRSFFPFDVRIKLVKEGTADLSNITVLDTSNYIVSAATFPTYFLKQNDSAALIQMDLDVILFASRIAPFFGISRRFVGSEPKCDMTCSYNETMKRILPTYGIKLSVTERINAPQGVISATSVRECLARLAKQGSNDLSELTSYVPATTMAFLVSESGKKLREKLKR